MAFTSAAIRKTSTWMVTASILIVCAHARHHDLQTTHTRHKRSADCQVKYATITHQHSACLPPSTSVQAKGMDPADIDVIVTIHNTVRREVQPTATNMMLMSWDEEIATTAQRWAENCVIDHDENYKRYAFGRFSVGQNLAWGSYKMTWAEAIKLWSDEKKDFRYGSEALGVVGHYTQMVWAESAKIGCGYANCDGTHYYVCDYGPAGNSNKKIPYKKGATCAECPDNCKQGLCSCDNIDLCLNGGALDLQTCKCTCKVEFSFFIQPNCALNCTDIQDPNYCRQWGVRGCELYSNVPQECPEMCGWCPAAGVNYREPSSSATAISLSHSANILILLYLSLSLLIF